MSTTRRDFIKSFGIGIASLVLTRCASNQNVYVASTGQPSSNLPSEPPVLEASGALKPSQTPTPEPTLISTEVETDHDRSGKNQGHPMRPSDGLNYYPRNELNLPAYSRLRQCWENLYLLERHLYDPSWTGGDPRPMLINNHLSALNGLVVMGELSRAGARELQRAYIVAIDYVIANSVPVICYD